MLQTNNKKLMKKLVLFLYQVPTVCSYVMCYETANDKHEPYVGGCQRQRNVVVAS